MKKIMILAASDVGHGGLKGVLYDAEREELIEREIPAIASHVRADSIELDNSFSRTKEVHRVVHDGEFYEVGNDATGSLTKVMHDDYLNSASWQIFFKALLLSYGRTRIDYMVSGLPVSQFKKLNERMLDSIKGVHKVSSNLTVTVSDGMIIPQPLGAMAALVEQRPEFKKKNFLLLDPGHHTFDWLVIKKGAIDWESSNSHHEGVDGIISKVISYVQQDKDVKLSHKEVDASLRSASNPDEVELFGECLSLTPYIEKAVKVQLSSTIDALKNTLSDEHSIQSIIVSGGGARLYKDEIGKAFPRHEIVVLEQSSMANARGYLQFAMAVMRKTNNSL